MGSNTTVVIHVIPSELRATSAPPFPTATQIFRCGEYAIPRTLPVNGFVRLVQSIPLEEVAIVAIPDPPATHSACASDHAFGQIFKKKQKQ